METDSGSLQPLLPDPKSPSETSPISPSSKGKAPMDDDPHPQARNCGICLSEEGHSVRGCIDSCDHYFCFLCIVEWSKIESRCPLCKGRFGQIRRMRTDGSFIGDRAVVVPLRNQIYDPNGNMTSGPFDPYSNISCIVCTGSTDENLLLLCDLCDTAVHTYCAGLGATIPEDDWFCQECTQMKAEDLNRNSPSPDHNPEEPSVQASRSIFDIVREPFEPNPEVNRLLTLFSPKQQQPQATGQNVGGVHGQGSRVCTKSEVKVTESSVRTLHRCRDANKFVRDLRENWNALRSGSLSFPSRNLESGATNNSKVRESSHAHGSNSSLRRDTPDKCSNDVDRAWKMFDIAKTKQVQKSSGTSSSASVNNLSVKVSSVKSSMNMVPGASSSVPSKPKSNTNTGLKRIQSFKRHNGCVSKGSGQHNHGIVLGREKTPINFTSSVDASSGKCTSSSNQKIQMSIKNEVFHERVIISPQEKLGQRLPHVYHDKGFPPGTKSLDGLPTAASGISCANLQGKTAASMMSQGRSGQIIVSDTRHTSVCNQLRKPVEKRVNAGTICNENKRIKVDNEAKMSQGRSGQIIASDTRHTSECNQLRKPVEKRVNAGTICNENKRIKVDNEAKAEIQSLVKVNLKLLSAGNKLEVEVFKDIARRSTHYILAACGLEPPRHHKSSTPKPVCSHLDQINKNHSKSSLMPNSCRECFYAFVKDVVGSIMSDKASC